MFLWEFDYETMMFYSSINSFPFLLAYSTPLFRWLRMLWKTALTTLSRRRCHKISRSVGASSTSAHGQGKCYTFWTIEQMVIGLEISLQKLRELSKIYIMTESGFCKIGRFYLVFSAGCTKLSGRPYKTWGSVQIRRLLLLVSKYVLMVYKNINMQVKILIRIKSETHSLILVMKEPFKDQYQFHLNILYQSLTDGNLLECHINCSWFRTH